MRIIGAIAILTLASACATTPSAAPPPLLPSVVSSSPTTTTTTSTSTPTPTSTTPVVETVALPVDLAGKTAATVEGQLRGIGFKVFRYIASDGRQVTLDPSWTVVSVDGAGSSFTPDTVIIVRVDKPTPPPPAPKTSQKTTPKPATPKPAPQPVAPQPEPPAQAYYKNCAAARAAGAAPVRRGQPGYGSHLDRDGDGIGCE
ncbi:MAG: excalibur calcium-binding domain-containing protein [Kibdelosporangium sp.]